MSRTMPPLAGLGGAAGLLIIYFGVLGLSESLGYAAYQFSEMWYWLLLLAAGFGTQVGLHVHIKRALHKKNAAATAGVAASGGVSTLAMVACCAHHLADILPILGLSAAAVFLVQYQLPLILFGVFSNLAGVIMMLKIIQKHGLGPKSGLAGRLYALDMKRVLKAVVVSGVIVVAISVVATNAKAAGGGAGDVQVAATVDLAAKANEAKGVSIKVEPMAFAFGKPVRFRIYLNTHSGSLDVDLTKDAVLADDTGTVYRATGWEGSPPGGHHRNGVLSFPEVGAQAQSLKLTIKDVSGVPERVFQWTLR